jgi:hypothetical protein
LVSAVLDTVMIAVPARLANSPFPMDAATSLRHMSAVVAGGGQGPQRHTTKPLLILIIRPELQGQE